jgi:hypothetical protein
MIGSNKNSSAEKCVECGSDILAEHSYCLNCGYRPVKQIISTKQKMLLMLSVFVVSSIIIIMITVNNSSINTLKNNNQPIAEIKQINIFDDAKKINKNNNIEKNSQEDYYSSLSAALTRKAMKNIVKCNNNYYAAKIYSVHLTLVNSKPDILISTVPDFFIVYELKDPKINLKVDDRISELNKMNGYLRNVDYVLTFKYFRKFQTQNIRFLPESLALDINNSRRKTMRLNVQEIPVIKYDWERWSDRPDSYVISYREMANGKKEFSEGDGWEDSKSIFDSDTRAENFRPTCEFIKKITDRELMNSSEGFYSDLYNEFTLGSSLFNDFSPEKYINNNSNYKSSLDSRYDYITGVEKLKSECGMQLGSGDYTGYILFVGDKMISSCKEKFELLRARIESQYFSNNTVDVSTKTQ